ncbi:MAG: DUF1320 domain-containing protein [Desulfobacterales bacterium]|jgi:phage gp36-like protein|nr:DUF1320 domain-containing protein [Desulfobacterales bacterium]
MPYCTIADITWRVPENVLIQLTDTENGVEPNEAVVAAAIADADEEIDAYLSMHYRLPFATVPAMVLRLSADLAVCRLYARCNHIDLPSQWDARCKAARRMLEKMAEGKLRLDVPEPADVDAGVEVTSGRMDKIFTLGRPSDGSQGSLDNY